MTNLSGKTALVTGASRSIGRATALALAKAGAQVLVHYAYLSIGGVTLALGIAATARALGLAVDLGAAVIGGLSLVTLVLAASMRGVASRSSTSY
jgi:3-oxoacyl-[acyl-carrier protein] reductase